MQTLTIVPATEADREWAARLMAGTEPWITLQRDLEHCRKICTHPDDLLQVAGRGGQRCGFILYRPRGLAGSPYIATIAVEESCRSQGVGRSLIEFVEQQVRPRSKHLFLLVSSFNSRARALYESLGFRAVGELEDYILPGSSEIIMHKRLNA